MKQLSQIRQRARTSGFTLVELIVYIALLGIIFTMFFAVFDVPMKSARIQTQIADMQANLRVARHDISRFTRMAGRGGLPISFAPDGLLPDGLALGVTNNVPAGTTVAGIPVVAGTDILTIRGVLFNSVYQVKADPVNFAAGVLRIDYQGQFAVPQDLAPLSEAVQRIVDGGGTEAMIAVSPLGSKLYSPFELSGGATITTAHDGEDYSSGVDLNFNWDNRYSGLISGGVQPANMRSISFIGILEEYRYFVRAARAIAGDNTSALIPRLTRIRFDPGTDNAHPSYLDGTGNVLPEDIADYIMDLQIALGVDSNNDGDIDEGPDRALDEWLFNDEDDATDDSAGDPALWTWNGANRPLQFVRVSLLARTSRPDPQYQSAAIDWIEDHEYDEPADPVTQAEEEARMFRRRLTQTVVDLRNF